MTRFSQDLTPEELYPARGPCVLLESAELFAHILQVYQIPDQNDAGKAWLNCDHKRLDLGNIRRRERHVNIHLCTRIPVLLYEPPLFRDSPLVREPWRLGRSQTSRCAPVTSRGIQA